MCYKVLKIYKYLSVKFNGHIIKTQNMLTLITCEIKQPSNKQLSKYLIAGKYETYTIHGISANRAPTKLMNAFNECSNITDT